MLNALLADLGNMDKAGEAVSKVYKCTVRHQGLYGTFCHKAHLYVGNPCLSLFCLFFTQDLFGRENETFFLRISGNDANFNLASYPFVQVFHVIQG